MRCARHGLSTIISAKAPASTATPSANMRPLTPPRNRMPSAIMAMTMKAPMSGSASSSRPTTASATAIGHTAWKKFSFTSILRTM